MITGIQTCFAWEYLFLFGEVQLQRNPRVWLPGISTTVETASLLQPNLKIEMAVFTACSDVRISNMDSSIPWISESMLQKPHLGSCGFVQRSIKNKKKVIEHGSGDTEIHLNHFILIPRNPPRWFLFRHIQMRPPNDGNHCRAHSRFFPFAIHIHIYR